MMSLNSMLMLNYPLGLTLIQSSLKALKGGVIEGYCTHTHTHIHTYLQPQPRVHTVTQQKQDALLELQQLRKLFCQRQPSLPLQRQIFSTSLSLSQ